MNTSPWLCLEAIPGLVALESVWQNKIGAAYPSFRSLCLEPSSWPVRRIPCARGCGCNHDVILRHDGSGAIAVCQCEPPDCPEISLTLEEITPLEVNFVRLGRALCNAFGFAGKHARLGPPNTFQFGSWSTDAVPAILTIAVQTPVFRSAVAELAAELRQPFILFAPTSDFLDAPSQAILRNHGAGFFGLDTHVILTDHGTLQPVGVPGEIFARFTPQPKEIDLDMAERLFALVVTLDTEKPCKPPTLLTVFRRYCIQELIAGQIAHKYECTKQTVLRRLQVIRARTGVDPRELRRLSAHIAKLEDTLQEPRARRLKPGDFTEDDPGSPS